MDTVQNGRELVNKCSVIYFAMYQITKNNVS